MDNTMNCDIIEKAICKRVAIYKAIGMLPPIETKDLWEENKYTKQNQNNLKPDEKDNCVTTNETKNESMRKDSKDITNQKSGIYKIVNKIDGKYYVGSTKNFDNRWRDHKSALRHNHHHNDYLQLAWNKYGEQSFEFTIVESTDSSKDILLDVEQRYLDVAKTEQSKCYNLKFDASGGEHSEYTIEKIRRGNLGKKRTQEQLRRMSIGRSGIPVSDATRLKQSIARKGKGIGEKNPWYGKGYLQMGESNPSYDHTLYNWFNKHTNNSLTCTRNTLIKSYNLSESHISRVINGKRKSHKGWTLVGIGCLKKLRQPQ